MAIGNLDRLPEDAHATLLDCIEQTSANTGTTLVLALSYSSRWEITEAVKQLAILVEEKKITPNDSVIHPASIHMRSRSTSAKITSHNLY